MALKVIGGKHFSIVAFGVAQILIDLEPLIRIIRGDNELHGYTHTVVGALIIGGLTVPLVAFLYPHLARFWNSELPTSGRWLSVAPRASVRSLAAGAYLGTLSHVALDGVMHSDMLPLLPFSTLNPLLFFISVEALHLWCFALGVVALLLWFSLRWLLRRDGAAL